MKTTDIIRERKKLKKIQREESKRNKKSFDKQISINNDIAASLYKIKEVMSDIDVKEIRLDISEKYYYQFIEAFERELGNAYNIEKGNKKTELVIRQNLIEF